MSLLENLELASLCITIYEQYFIHILNMLLWTMYQKCNTDF